MGNACLLVQHDPQCHGYEHGDAPDADNPVIDGIGNGRAELNSQMASHRHAMETHDPNGPIAPTTEAKPPEADQQDYID